MWEQSGDGTREGTCEQAASVTPCSLAWLHGRVPHLMDLTPEPPPGRYTDHSSQTRLRCPGRHQGSGASQSQGTRGVQRFRGEKRGFIDH